MHVHAFMSSSNRAAMAGGGGSAGTSKRGKTPQACPCARFFFCCISCTLSPLLLFSLSFTHSFLFDSTEAGDMKEGGGAAVAAADGIIDAVLLAGT